MTRRLKRTLERRFPMLIDVRRTLSSRYQTIHLDYPVAREPRWGHGKPPHPELTTLIAKGYAGYAALIGEIAGFEAHLAALPSASTGRASAELASWYLPGLDVAALYTMIATKQPATYFEIGSGHSTRVVRRAIDDHALTTRVVSIDPAPRRDIDALCDEVVRQPLERSSYDIAAHARPADIVFIDGSHRVLMSSDVVVSFVELLPRLPPGVFVHIHDVFLPFDYPSWWADRHYSEQYLLAAVLLMSERLEVVLPNAYVWSERTLRAEASSLFERMGVPPQLRFGVSFWTVTR